METAPGAGEVLRQFSLNIPWLIAIALAGGLYLRAFIRAWSIKRRGHPVWRLAAFLAGLGCVALATVSPMEHFGNQLLWANFLGFLVLTMMAAPLLLLGAPLTLAFRVGAPQRRRWLRTLYRGRLATVATFPVLSWLLFAFVTYLWQFTSLTTAASEHRAVRDVQLATLLGVSLLFWMPALCSDPMRWRMAYPLRVFYVMVEMVHKGLFGGMFLSAQTPFHEDFAANAPAWAPDAITDQRLAILILWIGGNAFFLIALGCILVSWVSYERRHSHRTDWHLRLAREAERSRELALEQVFRRT